jgi:hypothetical protein
MDVVIVVVFMLGVLVFSLTVDRYIERRSGSGSGVCGECGFRPDDMTVHRRLVHAPRALAPEDGW